MSNFLDCAKELEQCRQQQSVADELGGRLDATMNQQALWQANQGQSMGGGTGVPVKVLGYNNELGGYLVEERNGNISLMRSRSNSGIPTGAIVPAECEELIVPPAWVLSYLNQYPRSRRTGDYWFIYSIEYFDANSALTRKEFWLGGTANLLLSTYEANTAEEIIEFPNFSQTSSDANSSASISLTNGNGLFSASSTGSIEGISFSANVLPRTATGFYNLTLQLTSDGNGAGSSLGGVSLGRSVCQISLRGSSSIGTDIVLQHRVEGNIADPDGMILQQTILGNTSTVEVFSNTPVVTNRNRLDMTLTADSDYIGVVGNATISADLSTTLTGLASKTRNADVWYLARQNGMLYVAIANHPLTPNINADVDNFAYDYYTINQGIITSQTLATEAEIEAVVVDWRKTALGSLDAYNAGGSLIFSDSGDACIDAYRFSVRSNLESGTLKTATGDMDILKTQNASIEISQQTAASNASCSLGETSTTTRFAVKVADPVPLENEVTATTTILWAAP